MTLEPGFQFSQGSLQDYVECPRRFQLRHVHRLRWPANETEPALENERHLQQGAVFHRLIRQHLTGIPINTLTKAVANAELQRWWSNYLENGPRDLPSQCYPEVKLSTLMGSYSLVARFDLIALDRGKRVVVLDWKTNRRRPTRTWLSRRLQTHVYPYVILGAGHVLHGGMVIRPGSVEMIYWFANFPAVPERFTYDAGQYRADGRYLSDLVESIDEEVEACPDGELLPPAEDRSRCSFCRYRSLCQRGIEPGWLDEVDRDVASDESSDLSLGFEQIAELDAG